MRTLPPWLLVGILAIGCGGPETAPESHNAQLGPHAGPVVPLPGDRGYAEILVKQMPGKRSGLDAQVVAYFLERDVMTPLADKPIDVTVKLRLPGDENVDLPLAPEADPKESTANRYASAVGPYSTDQIQGELFGKIGGESFSAPFATAR